MIFYGNNYALCSDRVNTFLLDIGVDVWISVENGLKYDAKVLAIEKSRDLTKIKMDELHGILTAYEIRPKM